MHRGAESKWCNYVVGTYRGRKTLREAIYIGYWVSVNNIDVGKSMSRGDEYKWSY